MSLRRKIMKLHWTQALWGKELGSIEQCNAMEKKPSWIEYCLVQDGSRKINGK